ncbi:Na+/alanine symporter [Providencia rettgeri]|nr:Na+/alanine symporter [Providencia rettgeri]
MGSVQSVSLMWSLGDIGFGSMSYLNLIAIVFLSKPALRALRDFERQEKLGVDPVFDPKVAGIENAELWEDISREYHAQGIGIEPKEKQNKGMVYQEEEGKN